MKKPALQKSTYIIGAILILLLAAALTAYIKRDGIVRRWYGWEVRSELDKQMQPFNDVLSGGLGFSELPKAKVTCSSQPDVPNGRSKPSCTATMTKYLVVGSGNDVAARLNTGAAELSKRLDENGWKQRKDLPTKSWFTAIGKGIDYQPDQLNVKQIGDMTCTLDFFTAFSKPAPPAINMVAMCQKPKLPDSLFGDNF